MELINSLPDEEQQDIADFLAFIPIYDSKRRENAYRSLLRRNRALIEGKVCMEAGAGKGIFARQMAEMGAAKVYAVERSGIMFQLLSETVRGLDNVDCFDDDIEEFEPEGEVDLLLHEFYGPLVLDESLLVLQDIKFDPGTILPDGGKLWAMPLYESEIMVRDMHYQPVWKTALKNALVSDLFEWKAFQPTWPVFEWKIGDPETSFEFEVPEPCDFLAFCGEITHQGKSVLKMWWTNNWPVIYTPAAGKRCRLSFSYVEGFTDIFFKWLK